MLCLQGWFRDVTREDVADLLPGFANPLADPVHCTPPLGHLHHAPDDADGTPRLATTPMHSLSWQPQQALLKDRVSELKAQAATEVREVAKPFTMMGSSQVLSVEQTAPFAHVHADTPWYLMSCRLLTHLKRSPRQLPRASAQRTHLCEPELGLTTLWLLCRLHHCWLPRQFLASRVLLGCCAAEVQAAGGQGSQAGGVKQGGGLV